MAAVVDQRQRRIPVSRSRLARAVDRALSAIGRPAGVVEVAVVDDGEIRRLNAAHRGISRRTDVLAFPLEAPDAGPLIGQLVISADAAARQARRLRVPLALELDLLATHGTLHLAGYDDRDPVEADLMHRRERDILGATPDRLWHGLLAAEPPSIAGRRLTARRNGRASRAGAALTAERSRASKSDDVFTADRSGRASKSSPAWTAERSRRPSRTGHPRFKPASHPSLR
jgi:probable rRNA maturation factor